jgi:hypothetical protein
MANRETVMSTVIADKTMDRAARNLEAQRLGNLTGRAIDWRTVDCRCDESPFCNVCSGLGAYHEAFYLSCDHPVIDGVDLECEAGRCAEREARKAEAA